MSTRKGNRSSSFGEDKICVNEFRPGCEVRIGTQPRARSGCSVSILRRTKAFSVIGRTRARSRPDELAYSPLAYSHEYAAQSRPCGAGPEIPTTRILPGSAALLVPNRCVNGVKINAEIGGNDVLVSSNVSEHVWDRISNPTPPHPAWRNTCSLE